MGLVFTKSGLQIATNHMRIVHGGRGSYVEISKAQIIKENIYNPFYNPNTIDGAYYIQYRSKDKCNVKIYHQKRTVKYADYKIGLFYVSMNDVIIKLENIKKVL